jgi:glycosyltransferase involved in cell wall biosynthesis
MGQAADVCIILEGSYPYVAGGVSTWVHDLVRAQAHLTFHLLVLTADDAPGPRKFELPVNVVAVTEVALQRPEHDVRWSRAAESAVRVIEPALQRLLDNGRLDDLRDVISGLRQLPVGVARALLLNTEPAFEMLQRFYDARVPGTSFLRYFWSWRSLVGGLLAVLTTPLPRAAVYHAISTGYAGLALARAVLETGHPGLLTEHGIYTNERRIEIAMAAWLIEDESGSLHIEKRRSDLRDFWLDAFRSYAGVCYDCCSRIITLYRGNQVLQTRDGAQPDRMLVIPNGIDTAAYGCIARSEAERRPTVAMIGRVVPIKDVKTFIRATALLREMVPDVRAVMLGPTDEDPAYFAECQDMVAHLGLSRSFEFVGRVNLAEHLGQVDVVVLTSLSEAQPLVLLEAGAAGVPCVATDVGACRDIIEGRDDEDPALGRGGFITPLANPRATAQALCELLLDARLWDACSKAMRKRVHAYYNKPAVDAAYRDLYAHYVAVAGRADAQAVGA